MIRPRLACIVPFRNEARYLPAVLASLAEQTIDHERLYVIGVDSGSSDASDDIFSRWLAAGGIAGELTSSGGVASIPHALNAGLARAALDDIVVRLDSHTLYASDYLAKLDEALSVLPQDVWCVGGAPSPHLGAENYSTALVVAMYSNSLALGPADFRRAYVRPTEVSTVYLGAWRPGVLQRLGGFDERWRANEDCELTERIRQQGGRIFRVPVGLGVIVTRGAAATVRQRARYGFWRMQTFKRYPRALRARHVAPPLALLFGFGLLLSPFRAALVGLYGLYAVATVRARRRGEPAAVTAGTLVFFPLLQASYALGLLVGLVRTPVPLRGSARGHSRYGYKRLMCRARKKRS